MGLRYRELKNCKNTVKGEIELFFQIEKNFIFSLIFKFIVKGKYGNKKIWLTEFAQKHKPPQPGSSDEKVLIKFVKEFLPLLEHSDFIARYPWFIPRYEENHRCKNELNNWFCLDSNNSLLDVD